ncbi:hypothetical protein BGX34_003692, partial [Mortierella sp. NVP85]
IYYTATHQMQKNYERKPFLMNDNTLRDSASGSGADLHLKPPHRPSRPGRASNSLGPGMIHHDQEVEEHVHKELETLYMKKHMEQKKSIEKSEERVKALLDTVLGLVGQQKDNLELFRENSQKHMDIIQNEVKTQQEDIKGLTTSIDNGISKERFDNIQLQLKNHQSETLVHLLAIHAQLGDENEKIEDLTSGQRMLREQTLESHRLHGCSHTQHANISAQLEYQQKEISKYVAGSRQSHGVSHKQLDFILSQLKEQQQGIGKMSMESNELHGDSDIQLATIREDIKSIKSQREEAETLAKESQESYNTILNQLNIQVQSLLQQQVNIKNENNQFYNIQDNQLKQLDNIHGQLDKQKKELKEICDYTRVIRDLLSNHMKRAHSRMGCHPRPCTTEQANYHLLKNQLTDDDELEESSNRHQIEDAPKDGAQLQRSSSCDRNKSNEDEQVQDRADDHKVSVPLEVPLGNGQIKGQPTDDKTTTQPDDYPMEPNNEGQSWDDIPVNELTSHIQPDDNDTEEATDSYTLGKQPSEPVTAEDTTEPGDSKVIPSDDTNKRDIQDGSVGSTVAMDDHPVNRSYNIESVEAINDGPSMIQLSDANPAEETEDRQPENTLDDVEFMRYAEVLETKKDESYIPIDDNRSAMEKEDAFIPQLEDVDLKEDQTVAQHDVDPMEGPKLEAQPGVIEPSNRPEECGNKTKEMTSMEPAGEESEGAKTAGDSDSTAENRPVKQPMGDTIESPLKAKTDEPKPEPKMTGKSKESTKTDDPGESTMIDELATINKPVGPIGITITDDGNNLFTSRVDRDMSPTWWDTTKMIIGLSGANVGEGTRM